MSDVIGGEGWGGLTEGQKGRFSREGGNLTEHRSPRCKRRGMSDEWKPNQKVFLEKRNEMNPI